MVTMAESSVNWCKTHTQSHTNLHQHSYNHIVRSASLYYRIWNHIFFLKVPEGGGANWSARRNPPNSLPTDRYHILEEKIQRSRRELNPHPPTLVGDKLAWPRTRAASDPLSYRPLAYTRCWHQFGCWPETGIRLIFKKRRNASIVFPLLILFAVHIVFICTCADNFKSMSKLNKTGVP